MPVWLEVFIVWIIIGTVLNVTAMIVFRKRGYFKWLNDIYDSKAYSAGYEDAKQAMKKSSLEYSNIPVSLFTPHMREYGLADSRYYDERII